MSPRETEIVLLIAQGFTNEEIGQRLYLSTNTVKTYIRSAYRKMEVHSRSQAVGWVYQHRYLEPTQLPDRSLADSTAS